MAVGDVIQWFQPIDGNQFRPAAGVEVMITSLACSGGANLASLSLYNGTTYISHSTNSTNERQIVTNMKIFITNTYWINIPTGGAITGIQVG